MFSKELFGKRLKAIRKQHHENQKQLAELLHLCQAQVSAIEAGRYGATAEKIMLICDHYHVSSDYLLGRTDTPDPT